MNEDHQALTSVSGVGLKTAQRLILELKGKIARSYTGPAPAGVSTERRSVVSDAVDALGALGYSSKEAAVAVEAIYRADNSLTTPELVRQALRNLGRK
jgi:Holliday junction DNA helicase RuvA